jgi:hypothetical protein
VNSNVFRIGLAAAVLVLAGIIGFQLLPPNVGPAPTSTPSATPSTLSIDPPPSDGQVLPDLPALNEAPEAQQENAPDPQALPAGTYLLKEPFALPISLTMPDGWYNWAHRSYVADFTTGSDEMPASGWGLILLILGPDANVFADPCGRVLLPSVGPTVDDFVDALAALPDYGITGPSDVTLDGHPGRQIDLVAPDYSYLDCVDGHAIFTDRASHPVRPGERLQLRVFDIDGTRLVLIVDDYPESSWAELTAGRPFDATAHEEDLVELHAILDSIQVH